MKIVITYLQLPTVIQIPVVLAKLVTIVGVHPRQPLNAQIRGHLLIHALFALLTQTASIYLQLLTAIQVLAVPAKLVTIMGVHL